VRRFNIQMKIVYRLSESANNKNRPHYFDKKALFVDFIKKFISCRPSNSIYVIADNVSDETFQFLTQYVNPEYITRTSLGNSQSFLFGAQLAADIFDDDDYVYFAEDDYIYTQSAAEIIEDGMNVGDYISGYDHPDKYVHPTLGGNPYVKDGGEETRVILSNLSHWKITNSCCMTFAVSVKVLREDIDVYKRFCTQQSPNDFAMFIELFRTKGRKIISCIPGVSTHAEIEFLTPFIDWSLQLS